MSCRILQLSVCRWLFHFQLSGWIAKQMRNNCKNAHHLLDDCYTNQLNFPCAGWMFYFNFLTELFHFSLPADYIRHASWLFHFQFASWLFHFSLPVEWLGNNGEILMRNNCKNAHHLLDLLADFAECSAIFNFLTDCTIFILAADYPTCQLSAPFSACWLND